MRKKLLIAFGVLVVLVAVFGVIVALQPADYRIVHLASIAAPPATVFAQVNDFHKWDAWSPWAKFDPAAKNTFDGAPSGTAAGFAWAGNDKVGQGRMTITESRPNDLIRIKLDFIKPFESTCITEFSFKPSGDQTEVAWSMSGSRSFIEKAFCLFVNMDKMVGGEFEKGLAQMKAVAEAEAKQEPPRI